MGDEFVHVSRPIASVRLRSCTSIRWLLLVDVEKAEAESMLALLFDRDIAEYEKRSIYEMLVLGTKGMHRVCTGASDVYYRYRGL